MRFCFCLLMSCFGADVQRLAFPPFSALTLLVDRKDIWLVCKKNPSAITKRSYLDLFGGPGITRNNIWKRPVTQKKTMKKALTETQTMRTGCSKAEPKIFAPPQTPFPGMRDGQNLISWRWSQPLPINPVW